MDEKRREKQGVDDILAPTVNNRTFPNVFRIFIHLADKLFIASFRPITRNKSPNLFHLLITKTKH